MRVKVYSKDLAVSARLTPDVDVLSTIVSLTVGLAYYVHYPLLTDPILSEVILDKNRHCYANSNSYDAHFYYLELLHEEFLLRFGYTHRIYKIYESLCDYLPDETKGDVEMNYSDIQKEMENPLKRKYTQRDSPMRYKMPSSFDEQYKAIMSYWEKISLSIKPL